MSKQNELKLPACAPTVFQRLDGTQHPPLARFTASELFPVGLPVTFETPLLLGTRLDLQTLNEVPPAQNGRFSHLLTTENRKHRVICTIDAGVSRIGLFTPKFQTAFKPVVFESVVRQRKAPNLVCFPAAYIRRFTFQ